MGETAPTSRRLAGTLRRLLVGDLGGWRVGVPAGVVVGAVLLVVGVPDDQPFPVRSLAYWLVVLALALPAVSGTAARGGLAAAWVGQGFVGGSLAWVVSATPPGADYIVYTSLAERLTAVLGFTALFAAVFGTGGYLVGRLLLVARGRIEARRGRGGTGG